MKKLIVVFAVLASARAASAANLINEDGKRYKVELQCNGVTNHTSINPHTVHEDILSEGCVITISKQKHGVNVKTSGNVTIRKGRLVQS